MHTRNHPARRFRGFAAIAVAFAAGTAAFGVWSLATPTAIATDAQPQSKLIGTVDMIYLIESGLTREEYTQAREELGSQIGATLQQIEARITSLQQQAQQTDPNDPSFEAIYNQYTQAHSQLEQIGQQGQYAMQQLSAAQAGEVYADIRDAVDTVADREGYEYILTSKLERNIPENLPNITIVTQQVLGRPVLHGVTGNDITQLVREELGYPEPAVREDADPAELIPTPETDAETEPAAGDNPTGDDQSGDDQGQPSGNP